MVSNGVCDDSSSTPNGRCGSPCRNYNTICAWGTDCADCGPRSALPSQRDVAEWLLLWVIILVVLAALYPVLHAPCIIDRLSGLKVADVGKGGMLTSATSMEAAPPSTTDCARDSYFDREEEAAYGVRQTYSFDIAGLYPVVLARRVRLHVRRDGDRSRWRTHSHLIVWLRVAPRQRIFIGGGVVLAAVCIFPSALTTMRPTIMSWALPLAIVLALALAMSVGGEARLRKRVLDEAMGTHVALTDAGLRHVDGKAGLGTRVLVDGPAMGQIYPLIPSDSAVKRNPVLPPLSVTCRPSVPPVVLPLVPSCRPYRYDQVLDVTASSVR